MYGENFKTRVLFVFLSFDVHNCTAPKIFYVSTAAGQTGKLTKFCFQTRRTDGQTDEIRSSTIGKKAVDQKSGTVR